MRKAGFLCVAAVAAAMAGDAMAQSDVCDELTARLAALDRVDQDAWDSGLQQTDQAIARKRAELDQANAEARRAGCLGGILSRLKPGRCGSINATIDRLQAALNRLQAERRHSADDPYAAERERSDVTRALAENGCDGSYAADDYGRQRKPNRLFAALFPNFHGFRGGRNGDGRGLFGSQFGDGAYRTLCVRSCDGYYFPISFSTVAAEFDKDEATCHAMCPGTDVSLYVYRNPGEEPEQMVSLAGVPYTALPTAFRYRQTYDRSCSCGTVAGAMGMAPDPSQPQAAFSPANPSVYVPPRVGALPSLETRPAEGPEVPQDPGRTVRIVGPSPTYVTE